MGRASGGGFLGFARGGTEEGYGVGCGRVRVEVVGECKRMGA